MFKLGGNDNRQFFIKKILEGEMTEDISVLRYFYFQDYAYIKWFYNKWWKE